MLATHLFKEKFKILTSKSLINFSMNLIASSDTSVLFLSKYFSRAIETINKEKSLVTRSRKALSLRSRSKSKSRTSSKSRLSRRTKSLPKLSIHSKSQTKLSISQDYPYQAFSLKNMSIQDKQYKEIIQGIYKGCKLSNCYLAGGETAEMPGIYLRDKFDLAGFALGIVNKKKILDGSKIISETEEEFV